VASIGVGLGVAATYALLAGLSVPTLRAVSMAGAGGVALIAGRPAAGWNALGAAGLVVLSIDPASLFEPGFRLSFLAVSGILLWRPRGGTLGKLTGCTLAATLATAPMLPVLGLGLRPLGFVANLILVPWFTGGVVPLGLLCGALSIFSSEGTAALVPFAQAMAAIGLRGAELLDGPSLLPLTANSMTIACVVAATFAVRTLTRGDARTAAAIATISALLGILVAVRATEIHGLDGTELLFLDVGQGDATVVRSGEVSWLVDAGPRFGDFDAGRYVVLPALRAERIDRLDVLVLTHADRDHIGGASALLRRVPVDEIWLSSSMLEDPALRPLRRVAAARKVPLRIVARGYTASLGAWRARVLWPPPGSRPAGRNEGGVVLRLDGATGCALLPADVPVLVEDELALGLTRCTLLKLGHHGSQTSTGARLLKALDPEISVASASRFRARLFPAPVVRDRLRNGRVTLYETSFSGAVRVRFSDPPVAIPYRLDTASSSSAR
jgi:competence protein ComEC